MPRDVTWGELHSPFWEEIIAYTLRLECPERDARLNRLGRYLLAAHHGDWERYGALATESARETKQHSHFEMTHLLMFAHLLGDRFPAPARDALCRMIAKEHEAPKGYNLYNDEFCFSNDNLPLMACAISIVGGDLMDRPDFVAHGLAKLRRYSMLMSQYGVTSEFGSNNYGPWHHVPLSLIAACAKNREARRRARNWADFMFFDTAQRWHHPTVQLCGPHSRTYTENIYGAWTPLHIMLHRLLGTPLAMEPERVARANHWEGYNDNPYWALAPIYFPAWARRVFAEKPLPCTVEAFTRVGPGWDGSQSFFSSEVAVMSYLAPRFCVGSSTRPWNGGWQSNVAIGYWNLRDRPTSLAHQRTAYARTLLDDHGPFRNNQYFTNFEDTAALNLQGGRQSGFFQDDGLNNALQRDNVVLLAARPKWAYRRRSAIRHTLLVSDYADRVPEFTVDGRRVDGLPFRAAAPGIVVFRDGPVIVGLRPLEVTDRGRDCALEIERLENHIWISFWNYRGAERAFTADELQSTRNGFVWIIEDAASTTPEALHARLAAGRLEDRAEGVYRWVSYADERVQLGMKIHRDCPDPHRLERDGQVWRCPIHAGPWVQGGWDRDLAVGDAVLEANPRPLFLRGDPAGREYAVYNLNDQPADWKLRIENQALEQRGMGFGHARIVRRDGGWTLQK